ncbi:MAG: rhomboid family intramembrane serine protease [Flavobacteriales bacterium]|nr:rhomboid family intramembrane serine protease [Flavobacteriales bacterium]
MNEALDRLKYEFSKGTSLIKIIYLNVGVFIFMLVLNFILRLFNADQSFIWDWFSLHADGISFLTKPWTILTYSVFHSGFGHVFFNMILLYLSGQIFLQYLSEKQLFSLYFLGVIVGGLFFVVAINLFPLFDNPISHYRIIGASAGVMAVLIAIATYVPNYTVRLFLIGNVKLWQLAAFFIFLDFLNFTSDGNEGGHLSHIGGAIIGYIYAKQLRNNKDIGNWLNNIFENISKPFYKKKNPFTKVYRNDKPRNDYDYNMSKRDEEEKIDDILGKISKSGYESLNSEEKDFLFRAGKK